MANDPKCKYRRSCGYDFCMGEKGKAIREMEGMKYGMA
jgi:hypothetical protein